MKAIIDLLSAPWAIIPERLSEMIAIYGRHAHGEAANLEAIEAAMGKKLDNTAKGYTVQDGVAILPVEGVISKRMNLFSRISGGVSTQLLQRDLNQALNDSEVKSGIILLIDSPGGSVDGTQQAAQAVRAARDRVPVVAVVDGLGASAAYWIASAASQIFIVDNTTVLGSIGVVAQHVDWSQYEQRQGYKVTEITAGKYKRIASEHAPLTLEGAATIQDQVDTIYSIFVNDVAANRSKSVDEVLASMADGRQFIGQKAITAGLADGIKSLEAVIAMLNEQYNAGASAPNSHGGKNRMDKVLILGVECKNQAEVDAAIQNAITQASATARTEAEAALPEKLAAARQEGAEAERGRILAVQGNSMAGHEKLVAEMVADGKTTGPEAAQRILTAEKAKVAQVNADLATDAPPAAPAAPADIAAAGKTEPNAKELAKQAQAFVDSEAKAGRKVSYADAVKHVMSQAK